MEKIQQALEKARQTRVTLLHRPKPADETRPRRVATGDNRLRIDYRETRIVEVSPQVLRDNRVVAAAGGGDAASEAFRILRTQVLARLEARGGNAVAICGAIQDEGKTFIAMNLAVSLAQQLHRTALLVDLDLRNPSVHRCFGFSPTSGLSDYLTGRVPLEACLVNPGIERLVLLPQAAPVPHSSELLASPRMAALALELRARYRDRIIVYDCPPLLATNDSLIVMDYADGCLLVAREGRTRRTELQRAAELMGEERFLGVVFNDARWAKASGYYYYYG